MRNRRKAVAVDRGNGDRPRVARPLTTQERGQVADPDTKRTCADSLAVVARTVEETEDVRREELGDRSGHASEPSHEEVNRRLAERLE